MKKDISVSTVLGSLLLIGFIPMAPGTFGSLAAFGLYMLLPGTLYSGNMHYLMLLGVALAALISVPICTAAEKKLGKDAGSIVIDELIGYFVATLFLPHTWLIGLYAFVLFRVFDIAKPYPIFRLQKLPQGWGVVADDVLAGVYANILLQILLRMYPGFFG